MRVLISAEMGLGDAFLMLRFLPIIESRFDIDVQFECMPPMIDLCAHNLPGMKVQKYGTADPATFDYHLPMMSLPHICKLKSYQIPWDGPYIEADPASIEKWASHPEMMTEAGVANIGICWAGGSRAYNVQNHEIDKRRSVPFEKIKPLLLMEDVNFVSLQDGEKSAPFPNPGLKSFSDTAAVIELLDGVVTVDTAVANLAGAMGKPTWLLNRFDGCWRWSEKLKTPWFPTVRVMQQKKVYEWDEVISATMVELALFKGALSNAA